MVLINKPLIHRCHGPTIMTATEAKSAALQELAVNSRYSDGLSTGTGTDQIAVAAMQTDETPLTSAGKHAKLGELIGRAVKAAVKKTLANQNNLTPAGQCSAKDSSAAVWFGSGWIAGHHLPASERNTGTIAAQ